MATKIPETIIVNGEKLYRTAMSQSKSEIEDYKRSLLHYNHKVRGLKNWRCRIKKYGKSYAFYHTKDWK